MKVLFFTFIFTFNSFVSSTLHLHQFSCVNNTQCMYLNECEENVCSHKEFFPVTIQEIVGIICILFGSALSNAGGIGGGGLLIPVLILILNFYTHEAIPISKLMIFTGALTAFIFNFRQSHPFRNAISIDYNLAMFLVPLLLFGTMVGVILNKILPAWIILLLLSIVLILNSILTYRKGKEIYLKESQTKLIKEKAEIMKSLENIEMKNKINDDKYTQDNDSRVKEIYIKDNMMENQRKEDTSQKEVLTLERNKDLRKFPIDKIFLIFIAFISMLIILIINNNYYTTCNLVYWILFFTYFPIACVITYYCLKINCDEYNHRSSIGYEYFPSDIHWNKTLIYTYPLYAFTSGLLAGVLGIGGGLVIGPMLLELGLNPIVSSATSNFLVLFTSGSTSIQFIFLNMMNYEYGVYCVISSIIGSFIGTILIQKLIEKTQRSSVIVFLLFIVMLFSTVLIPINTILQMRKMVKEGYSIWEFSSLCKK